MKFNRLFWKIFAAFWAASLAIMVATSYAILASVETDRFRSQYEKVLEDASERIIDFYEKQPVDQPLRKSVLRRLSGPHYLANHRHIVRISRGEDTIYARNGDGARGTFEFKVKSQTGKHYTVEALTPRPPRHLLNILQKVNTLQFFIILVASTLVSFALSWSITRPLKMLGAVSRLFATGDLHASIDSKLLNRTDEIGDLAQDFSFMMQQTQQTLSAQQQLLHDVSHELRAPLARLQVAAELIQQRDEKAAGYIQRIHAECERMDQLIQRILNFSRMDKSPTPVPTDLADTIRQHIENVRFEHPARNFMFTTETPQMSVAADPNLLGEALDNILRNACKYTPEHSAVHVHLGQIKNHVKITVRDFGPGVATEDLASLTTPFYRAGNRMHGDGFGLGLSIARRAMEKQGGKLLLENHPEGGLVATLELPQNPLLN